MVIILVNLPAVHSEQNPTYFPETFLVLIKLFHFKGYDIHKISKVSKWSTSQCNVSRMVCWPFSWSSWIEEDGVGCPSWSHWNGVHDEGCCSAWPSWYDRHVDVLHVACLPYNNIQVENIITIYICVSKTHMLTLPIGLGLSILGVLLVSILSNICNEIHIRALWPLKNRWTFGCKQ